MAKVWASVVTVALIGASTAAVAQIVPGFDPPATQAKAVRDGYGFACYLATAQRPLPGLNTRLLGVDGEGLKVEFSAPQWFTDVRPKNRSTSYATVDTPEGKVWFAYDRSDNSCTVAAQPKNLEAFRAELLPKFPDAPGSWKKSGGLDWRYTGSIDKEPLVWTVRYWETTTTPVAAFVIMSATSN